MPELVRSIRRWELVAITINAVIGAGIFGLPSRVFALVGPWSLLAFVACAVFASSIVLCFAEVGSRFSETGGPYLYLREAFSEIAGFEAGFLMWIARVAAFAANCNLMIHYAAFFWPAVATGAPRAITITAITIALTVINVVGVRIATGVNNLLTGLKLLPLFVFIAVGLFFVDPARLALGAAPAAGSFSTSMLLLVYAFTGFEMAVVPAGEIKDVQRVLPRAIVTAIAIIAIIYVLIQVVSVGTFPQLASSERPLADAATLFLGQFGAAMISAGVVVSIVANLNIVLLSAARLPYAMASRGELPTSLGRTHPDFHTPHWSTVVTAAVVLGLTLSGSFIYGVTVSTVARLIIYGGTCLALPVLRSRSSARPKTFSVPGGTAISVAALLLTAWLLANSSLREALHTAVAAAFGLAAYAISPRVRRRTR
jgi:amino acid transporter